MSQNLVFNIWWQREIGKSSNKLFILLTENIEESFWKRRAAIECALNGNTIGVVVFLVVWKYHQLRNIEEATKTLFAHTHIDTIAFGQYTLMIIRLFHFNKSQRHAIYKTCNIRTKFIIRLIIMTCKLGCNVPFVVVWIFKINEFNAAIGWEQSIKFASQVSVVRDIDNLRIKHWHLFACCIRIYMPNRPQENICQNICLVVVSHYVFLIQVFIA